MRPKSISREMIVEAALAVIKSKGVAGATTRAIVQAVPCSEGSLYVHFTDRTQLLVAVLLKVVSSFTVSLAQLQEVAGGTDKLLASVMMQALQFHRAAMPVVAGVISDPSLLLAFQEAMAFAAKGPNSSRDQVAAFINREKLAGRVGAAVQADDAAMLLLYAAFGRTFEEHFTGQNLRSTDNKFCKATVSTILKHL